MQPDGRHKPEAGLDRLLRDKALAEKRKSALLDKLRTPRPSKPEKQTASSPKPQELRRPARECAQASEPPALTFSHLASPDTPVSPVQGTQLLMRSLRAAAVDQKDRVVLTWPERVRNPFASALAASLNLHECYPQETWTLAFYPYSPRVKVEPRRLFVDEKSLGSRALRRLPHGTGATWQSYHYYDYLLHATTSAPARKPAPGSQPILSPNLLELVPIFEPLAPDSRCPYADTASQFLGDLGRKRELLKAAPSGSALASTINDAPVAILGLPSDQDLLERCVRFTPRLRNQTDAVVIDLTRAELRETATWLSRLRKLKTLFSAQPGGRPAFIVVCADGFLARRCRELLADVSRAPGEGGEHPQPAKRRQTEDLDLTPEFYQQGITAAVKTRRVDFSDRLDPDPGTNVPAVSVLVKNTAVAFFRKTWVERARELRKSGYGEASSCISQGVGFLQTMASLPFGYSYFAEHVEGAEDEHRIGTFRAARLKETVVARSIEHAAEGAAAFRSDLLQFRRELLAQLARVRVTNEVRECLHDLFTKATRKSNRTVVVVRDGTILEALEDYIDEGGFQDLEIERLRRKLVLSTPETLDLDLGEAMRGGTRPDTLIMVQPTVQGIGRLLLVPYIPDEVVLLGDAGALGRVRGHLREVHDLLPHLASRSISLLKELDTVADPFWSDQAEDEGSHLPFSAAVTLDFSFSPGSGQADHSPRIEILTASHYLLRYRERSECIVRNDDKRTPFRRIDACNVREGDDILVMTGTLQNRLDRMLGPIDPGDETSLRLYRQDIAARVRWLPGGTLREKAEGLLVQMRKVAWSHGIPIDGLCGRSEISNVTRWLSARPDDDTRQPRAPRDQWTFGIFMEALGVDKLLAAQYWENSVKRTRTENVVAGFRENARSIRFLMNPHEFYAKHQSLRDELRTLWEEMTRSFDEVVSCRIEKIR